MLNLTSGEKVQIGAVLLILALSGYFLWSGLAPKPDMHVTYTSSPLPVGKDPSKPWDKKTNPSNGDPNHKSQYRQFTYYDGTLYITEYPPDLALGMDLAFKPDIRWKSYELYHDPMRAIEAIKDPTQRVLTMAAYMVAKDKDNPLGVLKSAAMTKDQLAAEKQARETMLTAVSVLNDEARNGVLAPQQHKALLAALTSFDKLKGEVGKDSAKTKGARAVVEAGLAYMDAVQAKRMAEINKYVVAMEKVLQADQKTKIVTAGGQLTNRWRSAATQPTPIGAALARS